MYNEYIYTFRDPCSRAPNITKYLALLHTIDVVKHASDVTSFGIGFTRRLLRLTVAWVVTLAYVVALLSVCRDEHHARHISSLGFDELLHMDTAFGVVRQAYAVTIYRNYDIHYVRI